LPNATRLVVGLGNPGPEYQATRHNLGFEVAAELAHRLAAAFKKCPGGAQCDLATASLGDTRLLLARPQTFMNRSGDAVAPLLAYFRLSADDLIVIHDDLDQDLGRIKVVMGGGGGGHRGVASLIQSVNTPQFRRVKVGIGRPRYSEDIEQFVLQPFYEDQRAAAREVVERAASAVEALISLGDSRAMTDFNA